MRGARQRSAGLLITVALVVALAGCGSAGSGDNGNAEPPLAAADTAGATTPKSDTGGKHADPPTMVNPCTWLPQSAADSVMPGLTTTSDLYADCTYWSNGKRDLLHLDVLRGNLFSPDLVQSREKSVAALTKLNFDVKAGSASGLSAGAYTLRVVAPDPSKPGGVQLSQGVTWNEGSATLNLTWITTPDREVTMTTLVAVAQVVWKQS